MNETEQKQRGMDCAWIMPPNEKKSTNVTVSVYL